MTTVSSVESDEAAITLSSPSSERLNTVSPASLTTIVVAAFAMVATMPGRTHGLGQIAEPLMRDFGITKVKFANINLWATLIGALFCFPAGRLLDRFGARDVLAVTLIVMGATVVALAQTGNLSGLYVLVTLTRGFGQSALSVISISLLGKSFDRRLAWPVAVYSVLMSLGFVVLFQIAGRLVANPDVGWRGAWTGVGVALAAAAPCAWFALTYCGSKSRLPVEASPEKDVGNREGFELIEALRSPVFWILALAISFFGLVSAGISLFNVGVLAERGFDFDDYLFIQSIMFPFGLVGQACCGWAARHWSYQRLTTISMLLYAVGLVWLTNVHARPQLVGACVTLGVSGGIITVIFFGVWNRLFGYRELGRIQGAAQMLTVVASAVGPLVFALGHAKYNSYMPVFYGLAGVVVALGVAAWFAPQPGRTNLRSKI